jgi:hypothetical protein
MACRFCVEGIAKRQAIPNHHVSNFGFLGDLGVLAVHVLDSPLIGPYIRRTIAGSIFMEKAHTT